MLLAEGADPNTVGRHGRTPLWRASYAGHVGIARLLLRGGADPRIPDEQGCWPDVVANGPAMKTLLYSWDTAALYVCSNSLS